MFKKLRDKISEEVQQTSLRLPTSVQQITQQVKWNLMNESMKDINFN